VPVAAWVCSRIVARMAVEEGERDDGVIRVAP
jgi:hypothetical protein